MSSKISAQQVAEYLRQNPGFFEQHTELLSLLSVPHPCGAAVSLVEKQLQLLRSQNRSLEKKLAEILDIARNNQKLSDQLQLFGKKVLSATSLEQIIAAAEDTLRENFEVEYVKLLLLDDIKAATEKISSTQLAASFSGFLSNNKPKCGNLQQHQLKLLFATELANIKSAAIVPLSGVRDIGILALGSSNQERFHPLMGVFFLEQLANMLTNSIAKYI